MTSSINPNDIDAFYPVAGQPNNTQGFRDNFAATQQNFTYAASEISELQTKAVLKSALTGSTLDNNMNDQPIYAAKIRDFSTNLVEIPTSAGVVTIDYSLGHYQRIATTGNVTLAFSNMPGIESGGWVRLQVVVDQAGRALTLPTNSTGNVGYGTTGIQGLNAATNTIVFAAPGVYDFEFASMNSDGTTSINIVDCNRPLSYYTNPLTIAANTVSANTVSGALIVTGGVGVAGNVNGGNLRTPGVVSAGGNVVGTYILGDGGFLSNVTVASNVAVTQVANGTTSFAVTGSGGNIRATVGGVANVFVLSNTAATFAGNVAITGNTSISGTLAVAGNITGNVDVSGTLDAGNLLTAGQVIAAGNITGAYFVGDGSFVENTRYLKYANSYMGFGTANGNANISVGSTSNVVVVANSGVNVSGNVTATGNVTGGNLVGTKLSVTGSVVGNVIVNAGQIVTNSSLGVGYITGAGGSNTQATSKSTAVTIDKICGEITTNAASLTNDTSVSFTLNNSTIANADVMIINQTSTANAGGYVFNAVCNAGNAVITIRNVMTAAAADAITLRYAVIKAAIS